MKLIDFLDLISDAEFIVICFDNLADFIFMDYKYALPKEFFEEYSNLDVIHAMPILPEFGFKDNGLVLIVE